MASEDSGGVYLGFYFASGRARPALVQEEAIQLHRIVQRSDGAPAVRLAQVSVPGAHAFFHASHHSRQVYELRVVIGRSAGKARAGSSDTADCDEAFFDGGVGQIASLRFSVE